MNSPLHTYDQRHHYPFTAIVGQEKLKMALLLNIINPQIGGALIRGERGSAKTIAVRGLADLLPEIEVVDGCRFSCDPHNIGNMCAPCRDEYEKKGRLPVAGRRMRLVELPVGTTEDRVVGTLNIKRAITEGVKALDIGILAEANRGILYVDNINLLDDHITDVLLDAAAMGVNVVEREGISVAHPASFVLIGSMNPEEGELRPQLHDRLAFHVEVRGTGSIQGRLKILQNSLAFERDPVYFKTAGTAEQQALQRKITQAQKLLPRVTMDESLLRIVARMCIELDVDGHRPDIIITRAALTRAAYLGRRTVSEEDMLFAAELTLGFRMRRSPFDEAALGAERFQQVLDHAKKLEAETRKKPHRKPAKKSKKVAAKTK